MVDADEFGRSLGGELSHPAPPDDARDHPDAPPGDHRIFGLGLLEPQAGQLPTIGPWLLAVAAQTFSAFLFVSTVLRYAKPHHHPETELERDLERLVRQDQMGASLMSVFAVLCWGAIEIGNVDGGLSWPVPLILGVGVFGALVQQQAKPDVGAPPHGEPTPPVDPSSASS